MLVDLFLPRLVVLLFPPLLVTKIDLYSIKIIIIIYFSKTPLAMQLPAEKKRVAAQGLSVSFHIGLHGGAYVRTYGRSNGSDLITNPKFLALMGILNFLPMVLR